MKLAESFLEELRARTPLAALIGRRVKLARSGRNWTGCCPFHGEKTPSFYVYDDHFHCFGCAAHGDAITFVMQSQGASFIDAVTALASEAGLEMPKPSPREAEAEQRRLGLHEVLEATLAVYRRRLFGAEGAPALAYLRGRGLSDETIARFGLGWSGEGRGSLASELAGAGADRAMLAEAGLLRPNEDGSPGSELFFNRVMFPIRDRRGRVISFGGRILGAGVPKYVNGPETPLFAKRRTLYGLDLAREAARKGGDVLVVEGYMDVIALHQAGFAGAVAPLGTALTAEHLEALWALSPAPVLCFDGDAAGGRAAARSAELALPLLASDRTLRMATLPAGEDPDTLVRTRGAAAFTAVLDAARPLAEALFDLLREGGWEATPEARAALRLRLTDAAARIRDRALAAEYRTALLDRFYAGRRRTQKQAVRAARPAPNGDGVAAERTRNLTAILLHHPNLLRDVEDAYAELAMSPAQARLRDAILMHADAGQMLDSPHLIDHLRHSGLEAELAEALASHPLRLPPSARQGAMPADALAEWWLTFGLLGRDRLQAHVAAAAQEHAATGDKASEQRLIALRVALLKLHNDTAAEDTEF